MSVEMDAVKPGDLGVNGTPSETAHHLFDLPVAERQVRHLRDVKVSVDGGGF